MSERTSPLCSDAIALGMSEYDMGEPSHRSDGSINAPYDPPDGPLREHGYHGAKEIGLVTVRIDFPKMWLIGWNLAEQLRLTKEREERLSK